MRTPATALWNQRHTLAELAPRYRALSEAVNRPTDLSLTQYAQMSAFALEFRPDLIIELGRGLGNSACLFLEVADRLQNEKNCRLLSLCLSDNWFTQTVPRLNSFCSAEWFARGRFLQADINQYDFEPEISPLKRCLLFWDAHGFDIAEAVLGRIMPLLAGKEHLVIMHDISDTRYCTAPRSYADCGLWNGVNAGNAAFRIGHYFSRVAQTISVLDFAARNDFTLHTADESLHAEFAHDEGKRAELRRLLGDDLFSLQAHWAWFSLQEALGPLVFPEPSKHPAPDQLAGPPSAVGRICRRAWHASRRQVKRMLPLLLGSARG